CSYKILVRGYNPNTGADSVFIDTNEIIDFDLSKINARKFPYLNLELDMQRDKIDIEPVFNELSCKFKPEAELAFPENLFILNYSDIMRGEDAEFTGESANLSLRSSVENTQLRYYIETQQGEIKCDTSFIIKLLKPDDSTIIGLTNPSSNYANINIINARLDNNNSLNELYLYNNSTVRLLNIYEDTIKPYIKLIMDGNIITKKDYVSLQPFVEVELYDNSKLPIDDLKQFVVKINGKRQDSLNTRDFKFTIYPFGSDIKAKVSFIPDTLYNGVDRDNYNYIQILYADASGNRDTVEYTLLVALNGSVVDLSNYPNPAESNTVFGFNYRGPNNSGISFIKIYNSLGEIVRTLEKPVQIGKNELEWDCTDISGNSVAQGMYYYVVSVEGELYVEPVYGICVIVR
ncbi:MAG: hypothetical protein QG635_1871, partial [Bacteroidota bacterium]|nr:hypothetical protein [Bacteroidota bacterium]